MLGAGLRRGKPRIADRLCPRMRLTSAGSNFRGFSGVGNLFMSFINSSLTEVPNRVEMRPLGRSGVTVSVLALGSAGILATHGRFDEACPLIDRAFRGGITYFDANPAAADYERYLGRALSGRRPGVFLGSKTHDRTRDGSWRLLEASLKNLQTDYLDHWQIADLLSESQLDRLFGENGAVKALREARDQGLVRLLGIGGQSDPTVMQLALERFDWDVVAIPLNAADVHSSSFQEGVVPAATKLGVGVVATHTTTSGRLQDLGVLSLSESVAYVLSNPAVSSALMECESVDDVDCWLRVVDHFEPYSPPMLRNLERRTERLSQHFNYYKKQPPSHFRGNGLLEPVR
jgi:predicted aldo/keto reductase-like oxidoreductase